MKSQQSGRAADPVIRRIVTGHDANGRAIVLEDRTAPSVRHNPAHRGHVSVELWSTTGAPVLVSAQEVDPTTGPKQIHPPALGTVFRISEIPPETEEMRNMGPDQVAEVFRAFGNSAISTFGREQRHPFMHRTESVDYAVVLDGEVYLVLDDSEVLVSAGDVVIQRGTNHAWSNRSGKPVKMLYVLIDGKFDDGLQAKL
jgi:quercetin dioxygenase-like cupin family protein